MTRRYLVRVSVLCALLVAWIGEPAWAQRAMTLVDLLEVPRISGPRLSPDGQQIVFVMDRPDWKQNRRIGHIWRINADGSSLVQLTYGEKGESGPRWSPDGKWVAFLARRGESEETQIHVLSTAGGEARPLSHHATGVSNIEWTPDGRALYFLAADAKTQAETDRERLKDDVYAFDENYKQRHLWRIDANSGNEQKVTDGDHSILGYLLSRDGSKLVAHRAPTPLVGDGYLSEIWVMDADGRNGAQLTRNSIGESDAELSPDGAQVLFTAGTNDRFEPYYNGNLFLVPASGGSAPRALLADFPYGVDSAAWSSDGRSIFIVSNQGVHSELMQIDVATRAVRPLTAGNHAILGWQFAPALDRHVFQLDEPARPGEIWTLGVARGAAAATAATPRRVTSVYDSLARDFTLPRQEKVEWKGADGVRVEGLLYYPVDYRPGTRYPLCVQTHGGPAASDKFGFGSWGSYIPVLTGKGYAVLKPNYRGSTGYGNAFLRDMVGGYFRNAHVDVMAGVDHLIKTGIADPDRLVKMGWSGGGHMTNKIITFTDRFKAASSGAGAANWISMYAQSDTRIYRTPWFGGTPWSKQAPIDVYWEHSPLKYVANVKTPTLFLVGERDERVPPPQSVEMHRALKSNGVPTRLYLAPREPHGWQELRHQLFKMNVELEWFETHAMKRAYEWEKPPETSASPTKTATSQENR